jgi:electron transport complex protein RnfG
MSQLVRMLLVLSVITLASGVSLGGLYEATRELAENNVLKFKKIPAVVNIYEAVEGEIDAERRLALEETLLAGKRYADIGAKAPTLFFVIEEGGAPLGVAVESYGQGFGGKLGVMTGFNLETDALVAIGVTTMSETPGVGSRVREPEFARQFVGLGKNTKLKVKKDGGDIDAITGATISSRAVADAVRLSREIYDANKQAFQAAAAAPPKATEGAP